MEAVKEVAAEVKVVVDLVVMVAETSVLVVLVATDVLIPLVAGVDGYLSEKDVKLAVEVRLMILSLVRVVAVVEAKVFGAVWMVAPLVVVVVPEIASLLVIVVVTLSPVLIPNFNTVSFRTDIRPS